MKNKHRLLFLLIIFFTLFITSCIMGFEFYTITFDSQGGSTPIPENKEIKMEFGISFDKNFNVYGDLATTSKDGYTFEGWYTKPGGTGKQVTAKTHIEEQSDHTLYAKWKLKPTLGKEGLAGGIIFYDKGEYSDGWRYIEAAPFDQTYYIPWSPKNVFIGNTLEKIGTGKNNTEEIYKSYGNVSNASSGAAELCYELELNGFSDWYLPSINELQEMNKYSNLIGLNGQYWSSTEEGFPYAYFYWFHNNSSSSEKCGDSKSLNKKVRAIRYF